MSTIEQFGYRQELKRPLGFADLMIHGLIFMVPIAPFGVRRRAVAAGADGRRVGFANSLVDFGAAHLIVPVLGFIVLVAVVFNQNVHTQWAGGLWPAAGLIILAITYAIGRRPALPTEVK
ncbi:hypothetical protein ACTMTI_07400 [Nonomuraea sp. H19]|uniref:hypothetical protein n=1 Tax=Nonomuraea sp. H19 TaxID=3452206 RepID=UPI003F8928CE